MEATQGVAAVATPRDQRIGTSFGPWIVQQRLSQHPLLYRARHETFDRIALLKVLPAPHDPATRAEFLLEARVASQRPDLILSGYALFEQDHQLVSVMEWPRGDLLSRVRGSLKMTAVLDICIDVANALASMHDSGVIHCGLRGDAIVVTTVDDDRSRAMLLDVGLCLPIGHLPAEAATSVKNSLAPENLRKNLRSPITVMTDVYALGSLCSELMTRRSGPQPAAGIMLKPDVPRSLIDLVRRCLALDPGERPTSALVVAYELESMRRELGWDETGGDQERPVVADPVAAPIAVSVRPSQVVVERAVVVEPEQRIEREPMSRPQPSRFHLSLDRDWSRDGEAVTAEGYGVEGSMWASRRLLRVSALVGATMIATVGVFALLLFALALV